MNKTLLLILCDFLLLTLLALTRWDSATPAAATAAAWLAVATPAAPTAIWDCAADCAASPAARAWAALA
jgi:hypothetical protein